MSAPQRSMASRTMAAIGAVAASGPWRGLGETLAVGLGHRFPESRLVQSFCRNVGDQLIRRGVKECTAMPLSVGQMAIQAASAFVAR